MKTTTFLTTFALDQEAAQRLRRLSEAWQVSEAEVVRRALAMADTAEPPLRNVATVLKQLHSSGRGLEPVTANSYMSDVRGMRGKWRESP